MIEELIGCGFWRSLLEPALPDPAWFVDEQWSETERQQVLAYLIKGRRINYWMGLSWCRFRCGESDNYMGACDLTDGTYCWPEGLAHYIENHNVRLPDEIVTHIISQVEFPRSKAYQVVDRNKTNNEWWLKQRGWHAESSSFLSGDDQEEKDYLRRFDRQQIACNDTTDMTLATVVAREILIQALRDKFAIK